jgi:hypothetical protein
MAWHQTVILKLRASGLFQEVRIALAYDLTLERFPS